MVLNNFVVFEGIDGAGTTTQLKLLQEKLAGYSKTKSFFTFEPSPNPTGVFLRQVLKGEIKLHPDTIARLFAADRCEHLYGANGIAELCSRNTLVVCDRYIFSNLAYQSTECGADLPHQLNEGFPLPQIVFYFDLEPSVSINRIGGRGVTEIYEKIDFLEKTRRNYQSIMEEYKDKTQIVHIDATQSVEAVFEKIWGIIGNLPIIKA